MQSDARAKTQTPVQAETTHATAQQQITHEQAIAQQVQTESLHQTAQPQAGQHIQIAEIAPTQTVRVVQAHRTKKASKAESIALKPAIISTNGYKKGDSMNAKVPEEKEENPAQIVPLIPITPRRVIPQTAAFLPLRRLFEKEKAHAGTSKVCGWCGRKAA